MAVRASIVVAGVSVCLAPEGCMDQALIKALMWKR